jgi:hypothetical protein
MECSAIPFSKLPGLNRNAIKGHWNIAAFFICNVPVIYQKWTGLAIECSQVKMYIVKRGKEKVF